MKAIQDIMDQTERRTDWFIAVGKSADRLSMLGHSYRTAVRANSFRYLYDGHILDYQSLEAQKENPSDSRREDSVQLRNVNINALNPAILQKFLSSGLAEEVDDFYQGLFQCNWSGTDGFFGFPQLCSAECPVFCIVLPEKAGL